MDSTANPGEPGFMDLLKTLSRGVGLLLRQEVEFAKAEVSKQLTHARKGVILLAIGAVFGFAGFLALLTAAIAGLGHVLPLWASALIIGFVVFSIGGALLLSGISRLRPENIAPQKTIEVLKEDISWMKSQLS